MDDRHVMAKSVAPLTAASDDAPPESPRALSRRPESIVARFSGPALVADADGRLVAANDQAAALAAALEGGAVPALAAAIAAVRLTPSRAPRRAGPFAY